MSHTPRPEKKVAGGRGLATERIDIQPMAVDGALFGWEAGHKVYRAVYKRLQRLPKGGMLIIDLSGVRQASHQALKEILLVAEVLRASKFDERYIAFRIEPRNRDLVESLETVAKLGGHTIQAISRAGALRHFGKLTKAETSTLELIEMKGELTSKELRGEQGLLPSAASNRLRRLHHLRLIRREERAVPASGGREFVYRPLFKKGGVRRAK